MAAVAERAGVTRRALYLHFNRRADLVNALFGYIAETDGLAEATGRVWDAPDSAAALDQWAHLLATYHDLLLANTRAVQREHRLDTDAARHRSRVARAQVANCRRLAGWLDHEGRLAAPWTVATATDMLWALISTDMIERLVVDRRWSPRRLEQHLALLFRRTFVAA